MKLVSLVRRAVSGRFGALGAFFLIFLLFSFVIRTALLIQAAGDVSWDTSLLASFALGVLFDMGAAAWIALPLTLALTVLPAKFFEHSWARPLVYSNLFVLSVVLIFGAVAEWLFWDEFGTRFNFIAVDYLVYTTEVLGNIRESYPLPAILLSVVVGALLMLWGFLFSGMPQHWMTNSRMNWRSRFGLGIALFTVLLAFGSLLSSDAMPDFANSYNRRLAQNGPWSLFAAFRNNELPYEDFYTTLPEQEVFNRLREELVEDGSILLPTEGLDTLRFVDSDGPMSTPNVIQITVESLSADFLAAFNPDSTLTPNLNALVDKSLFYENFFATGTRTVRGMEALSLSIPPTPGRSVVKRPDNGGLFTLGSVMRAKGYETAFLYGGYGYFDNMNRFFSENGYRVIDRAQVAPEDVTFANVWGACDQDLFRWTMREADEAAAHGAPFHFFVMTTSNHRPYSFPEGYIDLPSKVSGRQGAVKYTDYAIGEFLRKAADHPWFNNTVFVIVADHCAGSAGRTEIPLERYHIPLMVYAPGGQIAPGRVSTLMSQMDYAPTLLGLLNWKYASRFFGHDVGNIDPQDGHALVGTYQLLGHLEKGTLTVLKPQKKVFAQAVDMQNLQIEPQPVIESETLHTMAFYQTASWQMKQRAYGALSKEEQQRYCAIGEAAAKVKREAH